MSILMSELRSRKKMYLFLIMNFMIADIADGDEV